MFGWSDERERKVPFDASAGTPAWWVSRCSEGASSEEEE